MTGNEQSIETCGPTCPSCGACVMRAIREMEKPPDVLKGIGKSRTEKNSVGNKPVNIDASPSRVSWIALLDILGQPLKTLKEALAGRRATVHRQSLTNAWKRQETHLGCTYHDRSRIRCSPSFSVTSAGDIAAKLAYEFRPTAGQYGAHTSGQILLVGKDQ